MSVPSSEPSALMEHSDEVLVEARRGLRGRPPAIIAGGEGGAALSLARSLGRQGIEVHLLVRPESLDRYTRYARYIPLEAGGRQADKWARFLLGPQAEHLRGAVLLAASDPGLELLLAHRDELAARYLLDICDPRAQETLLNKLSTYRAAAAAGIPTPRFWEADGPEQVAAQREEYVYPLMVKPLYSHEFTAIFAYKKYFLAESFAELQGVLDKVWRHGVKVLLLEEIPGPDDRLCSYYTYLDERRLPQFHLTKRVIRRYPVNSGLGCYHITDWNPEVRDLGLRLFEQVGLLGLGNVEFKRDERDGKLKVIESNARFTMTNGLLAAAGYDLGSFVYHRVAGLEGPVLDGRPYKQGLRMWRPGRDFLAFLDLRARGELTLSGWLASVMHRQTFEYFSLEDPGPWVASVALMPGRLKRVLGRLRRRKLQPEGRSA